MTYTSSRGIPLAEALSNALKKAFQHANKNVMLGWTIASCIKQHFKQRFPGSSHYDTRKVTWTFDKTSSTQASGEADVNVPGASRAYHDIDIFPIRAQALTVPLSPAVKGMKAADVAGLFRAGNVLAVRRGSGIQPMFALSKHVHQVQDSTIMPADKVMTGKAVDRWTKLAAEQLDEELMKT